MYRYPYHEYTILLGATRALAHIGVHFTHRVFGLLGEVIEASRLTSDANCLPLTPILQGHKFIRKNNGAVKSTSAFADENKIKGTSER